MCEDILSCKVHCILNGDNSKVYDLMQDNLKKISMLVDCTKLLDNNISSKYLIIMRHVFSNSKFFFENYKNVDAEYIYINIIGLI